jgi:hypothetical protein
MRTSSTLAGPCLPVRLGLAAVLAGLVAGCSAASSSSAQAPASSARATAAPAAALSGAQLAGVLLPASSMPKGLKAGSATRDTGSQVPSDSVQPVPASQVCVAFTQTSYIRVAGIDANVWAEGDYLSEAQDREVFEEIDTFTGDDAQKVMATLWQQFGKCSSFSYESNGTTAPSTLARSRVPGEGGDSVKAVITSPVFDGGQTLAAIRVGSQVITTLDSSPGKDLGAQAVDYAEQIAQRLRAAG